MDEWIGEAVRRLPERQREALELHEREGMSYERIAGRMQTGAGQVAQLLERARINLYDELRGTPLATVAAPAKACAQALPAIAAREDGELDALPGVDAAWLDRHLADCERCRPAVEQMGEAAAAYRGWSRGEVPPEPAGGPPAEPRGDGDARDVRGDWRRRAPLLASAAAVFMLAGVAAAFVVSGDGGAPGPGAASEVARKQPAGGQTSSAAKTSTAASRRAARTKKRRLARRSAARHVGTGVATAAGGQAADALGATPVSATAPAAQGGGNPASDPGPPSGKAGIGPKIQRTASKPSPKPAPSAPTSTQASQPTTETTAPSTQPSPPADEEPEAPGRSGEAPGRPANRPPK
ncbi:MAG TPA: sigma factor-like helix-turn-helix DNA-binding protein [Solirubrobacterales bacterium]|nr:sigma factor-like helix-turn-helix DNA-binding protein [Solirubrobacterales bacterium]